MSNEDKMFQFYVKTLSDEILTFQAKPSDTVAHINGLISQAKGGLANSQRLVLDGKVLQDLDATLSSVGIQAETTVHLVMLFDIGVFGAHMSTPGVTALHADEPQDPKFQSLLKQTVEQVMEEKNLVGPSSSYQQHKEPLLSSRECDALCTRLDELHTDETDLKLTWNQREIEAELGQERVAMLMATFGDRVDEFKLRRVAANGQCINFHTDYSYKTMQICLNSDNTYSGGKLVFLTDDGILLQPTRPQGSATLHDNHVVHGVTQHKEGVRYALFLLKTKLL